MKKTAWLAVGLFLGYGLALMAAPGHEHTDVGGPAPPPPPGERKILYWFDPMYPGTRFDQPGRSPFMDMELVPRYADEAGSDVVIDPAWTQNLALTTATVRRGRLTVARELPGEVEFNHYQMARLQTRADGFVESLGPFAAGQAARAGEVLAVVALPAWQEEQRAYLRLKEEKAGEAKLAAAREKLRLAGLHEEMLEELERSGVVQTRLSLKAPFDGVIVEWNLAQGMNVEKGRTAVLLDGVDPVWVMAEAPESLAPLLAEATFRVSAPAWPGRTFPVDEVVISPQARAESRSLALRLSLPNPEGLLRPGQSARVSLRAQTPESLLVPTQSLIDLGDEQRVIVKTPAGAFQPRTVQVLRHGREETAVAGDLEEGEEIALGGLFLIDSEANLRGALERLAGNKP